LNDKAEWIGYQQKGVDEFYIDAYNMRMPIELGGQFYLFVYSADRQEQPLPALISYENEKPFLIRIAKEEALEGIRFSQLQKLNGKQYIGVYRNRVLQQNGIMILEASPAIDATKQH
jgi:hypothetical protein